MKKKTYPTFVTTKSAKIDLTLMPEERMNEFARATLRAVERYFKRPGVQEDYEKWLVEYRKEQAAKQQEKERSHP